MARRVLILVGIGGAAGTLSLIDTLGGLSPFDYRGGFLLAALSAAAIIIGAVCVPRGPIAALLSLPPLVWIGTISYGAYLWHYPIYVFVDSTRTGLSGLSLLALRFGCTFALATASYYLVERPVLYGTFWRSVTAIAPAGLAAVVTVAVIVVTTIAPATAAAPVKRYTVQSPIDPKTVVVLGDSLALTLGAALAATAPPGISVVNRGLFGCGLAIGTSASNDPPHPQLAMFPACNQATPVDQQWPAFDTRAVAGTAPGDVVIFVAGAWEVQDILQNGQWSNIEQPSFQRYELSQMRKAVAIGTAHGAHLDFTTLPALAAGAAFGEQPFPMDSPGRRLLYDHLLAKVAAEFPGSVSVIDYGRILSPQGVYTEYLDGVQVRTPDGIHTPAYAPGNVFVGNSTEAAAQGFYNWLSPRIWPLIINSNVSPGSAPTSAPHAVRSQAADR